MISPKCVCGHSKSRHAGDGRTFCGNSRCECQRYSPKRSIRSRPIPRRSAPKRTSKPRKQRKTGRAALGRIANALWAQIVKRPQRCESPRENHAGCFQAAHGFPKKSYPATRYLPINGWCLCAGCHKYYTHKPLEWTDYMLWDLGPDVYYELRRLALKNEKQDLVAVVASLRSELEKAGQ